jgi:hypothetical protein
MLDIMVFVLHASTNEKSDFANSETFVRRGSRDSIYKVLGPAPINQLLQQELLIRLGRGELVVAGMFKVAPSILWLSS